MTYENNIDTLLLAITAIAAVFLLVALLAWIVRFVRDFKMELHYIEDKIAVTRGEERGYWRFRRKRLWLSLIPFVKY